MFFFAMFLGKMNHNHERKLCFERVPLKDMLEMEEHVKHGMSSAMVGMKISKPVSLGKKTKHTLSCL